MEKERSSRAVTMQEKRFLEVEAGDHLGRPSTPENKGRFQKLKTKRIKGRTEIRSRIQSSTAEFKDQKPHSRKNPDTKKFKKIQGHEELKINGRIQRSKVGRQAGI